MSTAHNPSLSRRSLVTAAAGLGLAALVSPAFIGSLAQGENTAFADEAPRP